MELLIALNYERQGVIHDFLIDRSSCFSYFGNILLLEFEQVLCGFPSWIVNLRVPAPEIPVFGLLKATLASYQLN